MLPFRLKTENNETIIHQNGEWYIIQGKKGRTLNEYFVLIHACELALEHDKTLSYSNEYIEGLLSLNHCQYCKADVPNFENVTIRLLQNR